MSSEDGKRVEILQGTLDLIVLQVLATMGPQHAYGIASRVEQVAENLLSLKQGTLYPRLCDWNRTDGFGESGAKQSTIETLSTTACVKPEKGRLRQKQSGGGAPPD